MTTITWFVCCQRRHFGRHSRVISDVTTAAIVMHVTPDVNQACGGDGGDASNCSAARTLIPSTCRSPATNVCQTFSRGSSAQKSPLTFSHLLHINSATAPQFCNFYDAVKHFSVCQSEFSRLTASTYHAHLIKNMLDKYKRQPR